MPNTYTKIASVTLGSGGAASIDFTSIPSTYTDLVVKYSARHSIGTVLLYMRINGDTGSNYSSNQIYSDATTTVATAGTTTYFYYYGGTVASNFTASTFSNSEIYIPNYANTSYTKSISVDTVTENNATEAWSALFGGKWNSTAAITSLSLFYTSFNQAQYSTATLYGINNS
jgi:hypothetical protein